MILIQGSNKFYSEKYFKLYLKKLLNQLLLNKLRKNYLNNIEGFLKVSYQTDINKVISEYIKNIYFSKDSNNYYLNFNSACKLNNYSLESIINFIDYGNLQVRGISLFNSCVKFLNDKKVTNYTLYLITGGRL